ncbi:MAG: SURF1 family protein [Gammaproteobacteria bacterium]|nr:SURF1 family protein [Gammaproteobacteria bacterium]
MTAMRHYSFKPSLFSLILMVVGLTLFTRLGFWQLDRAAERDMVNHEREQRAMAPTLALTSPETVDLAALRYRSVTLFGEYDRDHEFLLDNQPEAGALGFMS